MKAAARQTADLGGSVFPNRFGAARLIRDAAFLASSALVNAAFGLVVWALSARLIEPVDLGVMTALLAVISAGAMTLSAPISDAYGAVLPLAGEQRWHAYKRGLVMLLVGSALAGVVGGVIAVTFVGGVRGSSAVFILVALGTIALSLFQVQTGALAAAGRASWVVWLNAVANLVKIGLLVALSIFCAWHVLEVSAVTSAFVVCLVAIPIVRRVLRSTDEFIEVDPLANFDAAQELTRFSKPAFVSVFMGYAVFWLTPFLVMVSSNSTQAALYALAIPLAQLLDLMTAAMATSLVVHASADRDRATEMARSMLLRCTALAIVGAIAVTLAAPTVLGHLNSAYAAMNTSVVVGVLCTASVLRVPFSTWSALQRSRRNLRPVLIVTCLGAAIAVTTVLALSSRYGAAGGAAGVAVAYSVLSIGALTHLLHARYARNAHAEFE